MPKICVVDFDKTLLDTDSTVFILKKERLFLHPEILFWGTALYSLRRILPYEKQDYIRRHLKFAILRRLAGQREEILRKYSALLKPFLNIDLVGFLTQNYEKIYVVSSAWQPLVVAVLREAGIKDWPVVATVYVPDFHNFRTCWYARKIDAVKNIGLGAGGFDLFTDSHEDMPLSRMANKTFWVKDSKWTN